MMTSPQLAGVIRLVLPSAPETHRLLAVALTAVLMRTCSTDDASALGERILTELPVSLPDRIADTRDTAPATVDVTLTVDPEQQQLRVDLAGARHTVALPCATTETQAGPSDATGAGAVEPGLGVGLLLMRRLMDEVVYTPGASGNRWMLAKRLPPGELGRARLGEPLVVRINLPATYRYLSVAGACADAMLGLTAQPDGDTSSFEVQVALQETLTNIVDHAYSVAAGSAGMKLAGNAGIDVTLTLDPSAGRFVIDTLDQGASAVDLLPTPSIPTMPAPRTGLLSSGAVLLVSATLVNAGNYIFNLLLGRWLGPAAFADLSLIVTLFLVTSFVTAGVQMPVARFVAIYVAEQNLIAVASLRRWAVRYAGWLGLGLAALFALGAPLWSSFFATASVWPFVIFGLFVPFYLIQGVERGVLQGNTRFRWLALTYQTEMWSRLLLSLGLVALGWTVNGAVAGIGLSFAATWLVARRAGAGLAATGQLAPALRREMLAFAGPVLVGQLGQILINNSDVLIVRRFFPAESAGHYAALALTGRIVFFATWSVVTAMFPIVAQRHRRGESHRRLLLLSLGAVLAVSLAIVTVTYWIPGSIVQVLFGPAYQAIAGLLWLYALATMFYALANVVINYRLSLGVTGGTYLAIAAGAAQVGLLWAFHASLAQVVWIQVVLMAGLFIVLLTWDWVQHRHDARSNQPSPRQEAKA